MLIFISLSILPHSMGQGSQTFNTPGVSTFTAPPGVTAVTIKAWGAGGGGGNAVTVGQGGGGGGGYVQVTQSGILAGATCTVTVGAGGLPGVNGGPSSCSGAIVAGGGQSGSSIGGFGGGSAGSGSLNILPSGPSFSSPFNFIGGDAGAATNPSPFAGGGGGAVASVLGNGAFGLNGGTSPSFLGGAGGLPGAGNGGNLAQSGFNGTSIGGGGGGKGSGASTISGTGFNGQVQFLWDCPTLTSISYPAATCNYASALLPTILPATALGGTFTSGSLGALLNATTGAIAPGAAQGPHVVMYGWPALGGCPASNVTFTVVVAPQATITTLNYSASQFCTSVSSAIPTLVASGAAGMYSSTGGLSINSTTGVINPSTSTAGTYTVTYSVAATGQCLAVSVTTTVTITALPTITGFDYPGAYNQYCAGAGIQLPSSAISNPNSNVVSYSYITSPGLSLNTSSGAINPATSTPGIYTVTITVASGGGCAAVTATSVVEILAKPTATIAYIGNPFCQTVLSTTLTVSVTTVTGGPLTTVDWSATPSGLTINSANGTINLNSTPGTYIVKYRFTGLNGCIDSSSTSVTIKPRPSATFSYAGPNPICSSVSPVVGGNVTAVGAWVLTLSNGQTASGTGNGPWSIAINTLNPGQIATYSVASLVDINCSAVAVPDLPGVVVIAKRTTTSGSIPTAANVKVCEGLAASVNVTLTSPAQCAPNPQFNGVFKIEKWNGAAWIFQSNFPWALTVGPSTTGIAAAVAIPAANFPNPTSNTILYRVSWVSLVDCNGCTADPLTGEVVIEAVPTADLAISAAPSGDVCPGSNITFTVNQTTTIPNAVFNWVATGSNGNVLGSGSNVVFGTNAVNTNLGISCPFNDVVTFTFNSVNPNCCNCIGAPIIRTVNVRDIIAPTWVTNVNNLNRTLQCSDAAALAVAQALFPVAIDNCDNDVTNVVKVTGAFVAGSCPQAGTRTNTWTVTDDCGNVSAVYTQVITIIDTQVPTWVTAANNLNRTLQCNDAAGLAAAQALFPVATDNCDANVTNIVKVSGAFVAGSCPQAGTYTNTWTVTDDCGNVSAVYVQVITIIDTQAPTWNTAAGNLNRTLQCSDAAGLIAAQALFPVAADNCDANVTNIVKISGAFVAGSCPQAGTYTNTWTVTDDCGNVSAVYTQVITIIDTQAPTWNTAASNLNRTLQCSDAAGLLAAQALFPVATDNCDASVTNIVKISGAFVTGSCPQAGTYTNTWTVTDDCGNVSAVYTQVITIIDTQAPTWITTAANLNRTIQCNDAPALLAALALFPVAVDNCDANVTNVVKVLGAFVPNVSCPQSGTRTNTWTVTDDCGNVSAVYTQVITTIDNIAPVLTGTLPVGQTGINSCIGSAPVGPTDAQIKALYTDNCGTVVVAKTGTPTGGNCAWSVTYTYTIADNCGNSIPNFTITYSGSDQTAPVINPASIATQTLNTGAGVNCGVPMPDYISLLGITATDCGLFTLTQLAPNTPGTMVFGFNGFRNVVIEAKDACGNISTITFQVLLKDLTPPTAICKPFTLVLNANGTGVLTVPNVNNGSFDNCTPTPQLVYGLSQTNFTCANAGLNNVILTVTDLCGNVGTCTAVVNVVDNTPPVISCFGDTTINKDANCTYTLPNLTFRVNKADACGIASVTQSIPVGTIFAASITSMPITLTVTDVNGNVSTCTFTINFVDVTGPVISGCPGNITVLTGLGRTTCNQVATWIPPTATDACIHLATQTQSITGNFAPGATFPVGVTTVTYTATDVSNNTTFCSFTVTVVDNTRPLIANCPANVSVNTGASRTTCDQTATWTEPTATDNCTPSASLVRTRSHAPGATFPVGTTAVTYTFTDAAGNVSLACTFNVVVTDNTVPIITCPGNLVSVPNVVGCLASVVNPNPTFSDNCGVTKLTWVMTGVGTSPAAPASPATGINYIGTRSFNVGLTTITYTATDAAGNTATCSYTVTVNKPLLGVISVSASTVLQNVSTTSTVSFTSTGGVAPYTIAYIAPTGGFPSAGAHTIVTVTTAGPTLNSSTIGGNVNSLVTTVPQSNATPGVYTYTLVSVTDALGCVYTPPSGSSTATINVVANNFPAPDLTVSIASMGPLVVQPSSTSLGYIDLYNVAPNPTTGEISFEVYKPANFNLVIGTSTTTLGTNVVNNSDFDIIPIPGLGYKITSKTGVVVSANSGLKIGFQLLATGINQTKGKLGIVLVNKTGGIVTVVGDNNNGNNGGAETYSIIN